MFNKGGFKKISTFVFEMFIPKKYGLSKKTNCPFCDKPATTHNSQEVPVCRNHADSELESIKCVCGSYLALEVGSYGPYFSCINCGNLSFKKGLEMRHPEVKKVEQKEKKDLATEMIVRSDDPRFFE